MRSPTCSLTGKNQSADLVQEQQWLISTLDQRQDREIVEDPRAEGSERVADEFERARAWRWAGAQIGYDPSAAARNHRNCGFCQAAQNISKRPCVSHKLDFAEL